MHSINSLLDITCAVAVGSYDIVSTVIVSPGISWKHLMQYVYLCMVKIERLELADESKYVAYNLD